MLRLLVTAGAIAAAVALAACGGTETVTVAETVTDAETVTVTETEAVTETLAPPSALPPAVTDTHDGLLETARAGDYEALAGFIPPDGFTYSFGGPVEGGPVAYWQLVEEESGESPIEVLARILELPYTLSAGTYVWPFAYDKAEDELTDYERELLGDLADTFGEGSGYLGWRAGIEPDGTWRFFVAGD